MLATDVLSSQEIDHLCKRHYNAQVVDIIEVHDDLRIMRIQPDWGTTRFLPGQYTVLGLGRWERRVRGVDEEQLDESQYRMVLKRAYSFSSPILDTAGHLVPPTYGQFIEFYVVLVRHDDYPPGLTPRLFSLVPGDRLLMGRKVTGHYTLAGVQPDENVVFVATGTGEAPHNAMIAELLSLAHRGRLVAVTCVRRRRDLGYRDIYRQLEQRYPQLRYLTLTTREAENLDPSLEHYVGKRYLQDFFESGDFEQMSGLRLDPTNTHVFLCGNPAMIGAPIRGRSGPHRYPKPKGMLEVLEARGFTADEPGSPGNVHFEKYW